MVRHSAALLIAVVALAAAASPGLAAKGGPGAGTTSSIAIASINGSNLAALTQSPTPKLGDTLTFATTVGSLAGYERPMIDLRCFQDVNGDGTVDTSLLSRDVVFTWLDTPSATFTLGAYVSDWKLRGGGPAVCLANLDAYGSKGGRDSIRILAGTGTWLAAG